MELKKVGNVYNNGGMKKVGNIRDLQNKPPQAPTPQKSGGAWNWTMNQLIKPVASAANALEDTGKGIAAAGIAAVTPYNFRQVANKVGFAPIQHQKDVFSGKNQRTYSTIMNEIASQQNDPVLRGMQKSIGYAGDFMLDPLNKVKVLGLTKTGTDALKTGRMALSAADQAKQGQRALLQLGKYNVLPSVGNKVLEASTAVNDLARSTPYVNKVFDVGSAVSGKIRPLGVGRDEFKVLTEAKNAARNTVGYTTDKAVEFAKGLSKELGKRKADDTSRALLLHAIEKGDAKLAPKGLEDVFQSGLKFKTENEAAWKALGGSTLEGYGLAHVATKEVAEQARKEAFKGQGGFKLTSTNTPQDIHRQWAKADGKIVNLEKEGIKYAEGTPIPKDPLLQEAGKYKSAEEFVNSLGKDRTQSVGELVKRGYPKDQAEFIARKSNEMGDMKSPSVKDILENPSEYTQQKGGSRTIFRVVPEGRSIENGDYVFTSKAAAEEFLNTHGRIRGQNKIVSLTTDGKNLLERKRHDNGELIFLPQEIQTKSQLTDLYNKAQGGVEAKNFTKGDGGKFTGSTKKDPLLQEAGKYKSAEEFVKGTKDSIKKVPLTGNSRKYLSELFQVGDSNTYIGYKKTGKVSDVMRDVFDGAGKSTGKMRSETPEIDFRVFQKEDGFSAENAFIKAQRSGNGGITTLDELPKALKSQLTDLYNKAQGGVENAGQYLDRKGNPVNVTQATAHEINKALAEKGGKGIFQEDLPIVAAKMGISTGRKQAATEFLEATKGLKSEEAKALANEVHNKMVNPESLRMALKGFDAIQNIWKAQALVAPSYHIRNIAGNLWNNHLADVKPLAYGLAGELQKFDSTGKLSQPSLWLLQKAGYSIDDLPALMDDIKKAGVIGNGQYGGDIAEHISSQIGKTSAINPLSQRFFGYRANRLAGGVLEDNAKIAHFLSKKAEGYGTKQAAESVKKYLFDYGDLTSTEQNLLKRVMPFYTWTSKNIPLQVQQFIENPGKFSDVAIAKKDLEEGVAQPNEQYLSDYVKNNGPIRWKTEPDGTTKYFLAGAWLPAAAALQFLSNPGQNTLGMVTPVAKLPLETAFNKSSFFQNTLGEYDSLKKFPGQKSSYLGMDLDPRTANLLRSIRPLNELDKLNPGEVFGGKNKPSFLKGYVDNASNQRGGRYTPEMSQMDRVTNSFLGKLQNYDPKDAKYFYDRDTKQRVSDMDLEIKQAAKNDQKELVTKLIEERRKFIQSRKPQKDNSFYTK